MTITKIDLTSEELDLSEVEEGVREIPSLKKPTVSKNFDGEMMWTNDEMVPIKPPIKAYIPHEILNYMRSIEAKMGYNKLEFGAFLKGELNNGILYVTKDFLVLKQKVSGASIDFEENAGPEFNGVIHRHPPSCTSFSGTDDKYINSNQMFSLLYVNGNITKGIINIVIKNDIRLQVELDPIMLYPTIDNIDEIIGKIEEKKFEHSPLLLGNRHLLNHGLDDNPRFGEDGDFRQAFRDKKKKNNHFKGIALEEEDGITDDEDDDDDDEPDQIWDLGDGYTFDGETILNPIEVEIEDYELPHEQQVALMEVYRTMHNESSQV